MIFFRTPPLLMFSWSTALRARKRSLNGEEGGSACVSGGEGSCVGGVSMDWRARQVE